MLLAALGGAIPPASLDLAVTGLRSSKGLIQLCLTADPKNFPDCKNDTHAIKRTFPASAGGIHIGGLASGSYAMAVIHDENGNAKLDTMAGIPREGIGFSGNPRIMFGPPRFATARFSVGDANVRQTIRMKYFL